MKSIVLSKRIVLGLVAALAVMAIGTTVALAAPSGRPQASITLTNCASELCNTNNTSWTLDKNGPDAVTGAGPNAIEWTVTATRGATTHSVITVNGVITITNTGSAPATIGNIVVNLQKPRTGPNPPPGNPCRSVSWISAAANVADATNGNGATVDNIVAAASTEVAGCNAAQGPGNYTVSGAKGTFTETAGSGSLAFTDADSNTVWAITPEQTIAVGASVTLLYTATFDNSVLGLSAGSSVRAEAIVTFGNAGARGGSGSSATNIDIDGDGVTNTTDEANVRSVPCRSAKSVPNLIAGNDVVTLSDTSGDVSASGTGISFTDFSTTIGGGTGIEDISASGGGSVSVNESCTPPASGSVTNTAHLEGDDVTVQVQGPQIGADPITGLPIYKYFTFTCVQAVDESATDQVLASCDESPLPKNSFCTFTKGGFAGGGKPHDLFVANYTGLTIGDPADATTDTKHDATWTNDPTGRGHLETYLPSAAGGSNGILTVDDVNPDSTSGGSLPRQTAALALNVQFGIHGDPDDSTTWTAGGSSVGTRTLCNLVEGNTIGAWTLTASQAAALNGKSVSSVLADANNAIGGDGLAAVYGTDTGGFGNLNELVTTLNEAYDNCDAKAFATDHLCAP